MKETIHLIETALLENKEVLRRLAVEQENFIGALADNHFKKRELSNQNMNLERQLKDLYDQTYNLKEHSALKSGANPDCDFKELKKRDY